MRHKSNISGLIVATLLVFLLPFHLIAQQKEITIPEIPDSPEEFVKIRNKLAKTPEGGAAMLITALLAFSKNRNLGLACLTIALDKSNLTKGNAYKGYRPARSFDYHLRRMEGKGWWPFLGFAYLKGGTPKNGYRLTAPYTVVTSRNRSSGDESKGRVKIFVNVYGFHPRPMILKRDRKGNWKALGISSFFLDIYPPEKKSQETEDL